MKVIFKRAIFSLFVTLALIGLAITIVVFFVSHAVWAAIVLVGGGVIGITLFVYFAISDEVFPNEGDI